LLIENKGKYQHSIILSKHSSKELYLFLKDLYEPREIKHTKNLCTVDHVNNCTNCKECNKIKDPSNKVLNDNFDQKGCVIYNMLSVSSTNKSMELISNNYIGCEVKENCDQFNENTKITLHKNMTINKSK